MIINILVAITKRLIKTKLNKMEKEFVPYELALRVKAIGFDEPCIGVYYGDEDDIQFVLDVRETQYYAQKGYKNGMLAPTYLQAFKWIMQFPPLNKWACNIAVYSDGTYSIKDGKYAVHEYLSSEECLDKLLEIVESKSE